ncbi:hypothetical protein [Lysinibacillus capsici]|uniref:hypothetical protein n=1 Tax=Lysinibacillus capsici TaxID=2115968 RepID=UPI0024805DAF|nr:hypothetical protein [Lysinibacillus capsici]
MHVYEIDDKGFIINNYYDNGDVEIPDGCITVQLPQPMPFHKPKWNGTEWVEGETEEEKGEREANQLLESLRPSPSEIADAELEIKMLTMLTELGVIQ